MQYKLNLNFDTLNFSEEPMIILKRNTKFIDDFLIKVTSSYPQTKFIKMVYKSFNQSIKEDYWFLPLMKNYANCLHVLEVKKITEEEIRQQISILNK